MYILKNIMFYYIPDITLSISALHVFETEKTSEGRRKYTFGVGETDDISGQIVVGRNSDRYVYIYKTDEHVMDEELMQTSC